MEQLFYNLTNLSKKDLQKIHIFAYYRCNFQRLTFKLMIIAFMFLISVDYAIKDENGKALILICVATLYEVIFRPFLNPNKIEKQEISLKAYENYIILNESGDKILIYYNDIKNIMENKKYYFIISFNNTYIAIDKNSFINGDNSEFKKFILEKISGNS